MAYTVCRHTLNDIVIIMNKRLVKRELAQIENEIRHLDRAINAGPPGKLILVKNGKYAKFFQSINGKAEYIPKSKHQLAVDLAQKKYHTLLKDYYYKEHSALECYLAACGTGEETALDEFLSLPAVGHLLSDKLLQPLPENTASRENALAQELRDWAAEQFEANPFYISSLTIRTPSGRFVRSKSEAVIETALLRHNIPFRYEAPLTLEGETYYPDFTLRHPANGKTIYWEHFGKMDDLGYLQHAIRKLQVYMRNGIIPGLNLIITSETGDFPLDEFFINSLVEAWFS